MYLGAKSEVSSIILTSFRHGQGNFTHPHPLPLFTLKRTPKKPTQIKFNVLSHNVLSEAVLTTY